MWKRRRTETKRRSARTLFHTDGEKNWTSFSRICINMIHFQYRTMQKRMPVKDIASNLFNKSARTQRELTLKSLQFVESSSKKTWHLNSADSSLQVVVKLYIQREELLLWSPDRRVSLRTASSARPEEEETTAPHVRHDTGRKKPTPVPP